MKSHYQLILFILLYAAGCNAPNSNSGIDIEHNTATDSLFVPTGNAKLDSLLHLATVMQRYKPCFAL